MSGWPDFRYYEAELAPLEQRFLLLSGEVLNAVQHVKSAERDQLRIDLLSDEAKKTSAIEGERLDRRSVSSSLRRHPGMPPPAGWAGKDTLRLSLGVVLCKEVTEDGYAILFSGKRLSPDLIDSAMEELRRIFEAF